MPSHGVRVKIKGVVFALSVDGLTLMEVSAIAAEVEKRIKCIEEKTQIPDDCKLAMLAALEIAVEVYRYKQQLADDSGKDAYAIEVMINKLEKVRDS